MQHLDKLNNFNGVKEILAGLQSSAVYRLKKTKEVRPDEDSDRAKKNE
jgi:hypothetical protein